VGKISTNDSQKEQRRFQWQSLPAVLGALAKLRIFASCPSVSSQGALRLPLEWFAWHLVL